LCDMGCRYRQNKAVSSPSGVVKLKPPFDPVEALVQPIEPAIHAGQVDLYTSNITLHRRNAPDQQVEFNINRIKSFIDPSQVSQSQVFRFVGHA
jgi:hypothetical protein